MRFMPLKIAAAVFIPDGEREEYVQGSGTLLSIYKARLFSSRWGLLGWDSSEAMGLLIYPGMEMMKPVSMFLKY